MRKFVKVTINMKIKCGRFIIKWRRFCFVRNQEYIGRKVDFTLFTCHQVLLQIPDGANAFGEKREQCSLRVTDSAENIVPPATQIKVYLEGKVLHLSRTYFGVHPKCDLLDLDFINRSSHWQWPMKIGVLKKFAEFTSSGALALNECKYCLSGR